MTACVVWTRAYFAKGQQPRWMLLVFGIFTVIYAVVLFRTRDQIWVDGHAGGAWQPLTMMVFFVAAVASIVLRELVDRRASAGEA